MSDRGGGRSAAAGAHPCVVETLMQNPVRMLPYPPDHYKKLKGSANWESWKLLFTMFLEHIHLDGYIRLPTTDSELERPDSEAAREDSHVRLCIALSLEESLLIIIESKRKRAYDMWKALCGTFEYTCPQRRLTLMYKFINLKRADFSSLTEYVLSAKELTDKLRELGNMEYFFEEFSSVQILSNLRPEDKMIRLFAEEECCETIDGSLILRYDPLIKKLLLEGLRETAESKVTSTALTAVVPRFSQGARGRGSARGVQRGVRGHHGFRGGRGGSHRKDNNEQDSGQVPPYMLQRCKWCHKTNHLEINCYYRAGAKRKRDQMKDTTGKRGGKGLKNCVRGMGGRPESEETPLASTLIAQQSTADALSSGLDLVCKPPHTSKFISGAPNSMSGEISVLSNHSDSPSQCSESAAGDEVLHIKNELFGWEV